MSHFEIFGLYFVLNLILLLVLFTGVIRIRLSGVASLGDGDHPPLIRAIRAHGNFVENAPFVFIGMMSLMQLGTSSLMLHVVGGTFTLSRILHARGMYQDAPVPNARRIGTILTLLTYIILIAYIGFLIFASRGSYGIS